MAQFEPLFKNPHVQTIAGRFWPRTAGGARVPVEEKLYRTEPHVQLLVKTQKPAGGSRGDVLIVHGLEGSADATYMRSMALCAIERGYTAHRLNLRSCGGTEHLASRTVYHGGLTSDLLAVLQALATEGRTPLWMVGFSLGGNLAVKLAGELGDGGPALLAGVCVASAALDLAACAERLNRPENRLYEYRFLRLMRARARTVWGTDPAELRAIRSVRDMDDRITAPRLGFEGADHYYRTQSCNQFLDRIRVPTLFIAAKDDTVIPFTSYDHPAFRQNPYLCLLATDHGGHLGFLAKGRSRLWLEHAIMGWIAGNNETNGPLISSGN